MANDETKDEVQLKDAGRRALLKAATVAGGAVAASALLPGSWKKPVATVGGLPAHAQTSQTITLTDAQATTLIGDGARAIAGPILAYCRYEDALGEMDDSHQVTYRVMPLVNGTTAADGDCGLSHTYSFSQLEHYGEGDGFSGWVKFLVNSSCFPPGSMAWSIHKGSNHVSNVVNAAIRISPA